MQLLNIFYVLQCIAFLIYFYVTLMKVNNMKTFNAIMDSFGSTKLSVTYQKPESILWFSEKSSLDHVYIACCVQYTNIKNPLNESRSNILRPKLIFVRSLLKLVDNKKLFKQTAGASEGGSYYIIRDSRWSILQRVAAVD